eukprot:Nk52_evm57s2309 gene=Nk52_evmTU57s2309
MANSVEEAEEDKCPIILDFFVEASQVLSLIKNIEAVKEKYKLKEVRDLERESKGAFEDKSEYMFTNVVDVETCEKSCFQVIEILEKYQEQPPLLDSSLEDVVNALLILLKGVRFSKGEKVDDEENARSLTDRFGHLVLKMLYILTKVRGYKTVIKLLPHEVADFQPTLELLEAQDAEDVKTWHSRYFLLLWLSILCLVPFDMCILDICDVKDYYKNPSQNGFSEESIENALPKESIVMRIMSVCKLYLTMKDKTADGAGVLVSRFVTRPDMKDVFLKPFINWCRDTVTDAIDTYEVNIHSVFAIVGVLKGLCCLTGNGKREDLLPHCGDMLDLLEICRKKSYNPLLRKLSVKLVQRIGLLFLEPRTISWRYQRGNRSLAIGQESEVKSNIEQDVTSGGSCDDEDFECPDELEDVIEALLNGLRDPDTIVRWSAAKGIGRITGRLSSSFADDVLESVLRLFSLQEGDGAWHGGCLAVAELARRGLLLPRRLAEVVPLTSKALVYDVRKGSYSVGSHVRDAGCYVCWAMARAYEPSVLKPYNQVLASSLLVTTVFDREVNCRRAASAAFQEHVGRQGNFPHGIDILTAADYFTVGNRGACYLDISVFISQFAEYGKSLVDHLVLNKICHWDQQIRCLASKAIQALCKTQGEYILSKLPEIIQYTRSHDIAYAHGGLLAAGDIVQGCFGLSVDEQSSQKYVFEEKAKENLLGLVSYIVQHRFYQGDKCEFIRVAVCYFIRNICNSDITISEKMFNEWEGILTEECYHTEVEVQKEAANALKELCVNFLFPKAGNDNFSELKERFFLPKMELLKHNMAAKRGIPLAIGRLPYFMLKDWLYPIISILIENAASASVEHIDIEGRKACFEGLLRLAMTKEERSPSGVCIVSVDVTREIIRTFIKGSRNYTIDNRGDVGSLIRRDCVEHLVIYSEFLLKQNIDIHEALDKEMCLDILCCIVEQTMSKIDRVRRCASLSFFELLYWESPAFPNFPERDELRKAFPKQDLSSCNWVVPTEAFPILVKFLSFASYRYYALLSVIPSVGGLTESLVKGSWSALSEHLKSLINCGDKNSLDELNAILCDFTVIFEKCARNGRIMVPMLKALDFLFASNILVSLNSATLFPFVDKVLCMCKTESARCTDVSKLVVMIGVLCNLLQFDIVDPRAEDNGKSIAKRSFQQLAVMLGSRYPRVRRETADQLMVGLMTYDEAFGDVEIEEALEVIGDTEWENTNLSLVREARNSVCDFLNLPAPVATTKGSISSLKKKPTKAKDAEDEFESYRDLISRVQHY